MARAYKRVPSQGLFCRLEVLLQRPQRKLYAPRFSYRGLGDRRDGAGHPQATAGSGASARRRGPFYEFWELGIYYKHIIPHKG